MKCLKCGSKIIKEQGEIPHCESCGIIPKRYNKQAEEEMRNSEDYSRSLDEYSEDNEWFRAHKRLVR